MAGVQHPIRSRDVREPAVPELDEMIDGGADAARRRRPRRARTGSRHRPRPSVTAARPSSRRRPIRSSSVRRSVRMTPSTRLSAREARGRWRAPAGPASRRRARAPGLTPRTRPRRPAMNEWKNGSAAMTSGLRPITSPHAKDLPVLSDRARQARRPAEFAGDLEDAVARLGRDARAVVQRERHEALAHAGAARDIGDGRRLSPPSLTSSCCPPSRRRPARCLRRKPVQSEI